MHACTHNLELTQFNTIKKPRYLARFVGNKYSQCNWPNENSNEVAIFGQFNEAICTKECNICFISCSIGEGPGGPWHLLNLNAVHRNLIFAI